MPWRNRAKIRNSPLPAEAERMLAPAKIARPDMNTIRRPRLSAKRPVAISSAAKTRL